MALEVWIALKSCMPKGTVRHHREQCHWKYLEDHPRTYKWSVTPIYKPWRGHLEGVPQPYLGDLRLPRLLTTYKSWDDPPSRRILGCFWWPQYGSFQTLPFLWFAIEWLGNWKQKGYINITQDVGFHPFKSLQESCPLGFVPMISWQSVDFHQKVFQEMSTYVGNTCETQSWVSPGATHEPNHFILCVMCKVGWKWSFDAHTKSTPNCQQKRYSGLSSQKIKWVFGLWSYLEVQTRETFFGPKNRLCQVMPAKLQCTYTRGKYCSDCYHRKHVWRPDFTKSCGGHIPGLLLIFSEIRRG